MSNNRFLSLFNAPTTLWRAGALAAALLVALPGCDGNSSDDNGEEALSVRSLPWIRSEDRRLVDEFGREIAIRGVNARIEGLFDVSFDDGRIALEPIPAFDREDAQAMVRYGFNVLRLPINWSGAEPREGEISQAYFQRLDEVIDFARESGLYVLIDFHQDAWSKEIGEDGAPLWAIIPPPEQLLEGPLEDLGARRVSAQVLNAFRGFFENREGIQDRFLPVWKHTVARYADRPEVIGFEPMNEPFSAHVDPTQKALHAFYRKVLPPMRAVNQRHLLWLEPDVIRNFGTSAPLLAEPFPDDQVVYCPHIYPSAVNASSYAQWRDWLTENYGNMQREAQSWGAALVVGEWGTHPDSPDAEGYIRAQQEVASAFGSGQMLWLWKEDSQGSWGFYDVDDATGEWIVRDAAVKQFGKPYAQAVPGRLLAQDFDADTGELSLTFVAQGGERAGPLLYLPESWFEQLPTILLNGSAVAYERDAASQRVLLDWDGGAGTFEVRVY